MSHEYQAWHLTRQYLCDLLSDLKMTIWYEWGGKEGFSLSSSETPLPAYRACAVLMEQLKGYRLEKRLTLENPRDFTVRFVNDSGAVKLVAWTAQPPGQTPDKIQSHAVSIPVEAQGSLETADLYGKKGAVQVQEGTIRLTLTGALQYVTLSAGQ